MGCIPSAITSARHGYEHCQLKQLTMNMIVLLALLTGQRLQTLRAIELEHMDLHQQHCTIYIQKVLKTTKPGKHIRPIVFRRYHIASLCIVQHLHRYCALTASLRQHPGRGHLLISFRKPHGPVVKDTLSRWIKNSLAAAGINTTLFGAHSTRSAFTSTAARHGALELLELMLKAANWQQAKTFAKFYHRDVPSLDTGFMDAVLPDLRDKQSS